MIAVVTVNPHLVITQDGRHGMLIARQGLRGAVVFGKQRIVETFKLESLTYYMPPKRETLKP